MDWKRIRTIDQFVRCVLIAVALLTSAQLVGCGGVAGYRLKGKVIKGDISFIAIVPSDDPRLEGPGIPGVAITLQSDPNKLNRASMGETRTTSDGAFTLSVDRVGAGFFMYDVGLSADRTGYEHTTSQFNLPPSDRRVLIILRPGVNHADTKDDAWSDYEKYR